MNYISIKIGVHNLMVMALLQKKYPSQDIELSKWKKGTPRQYKIIIFFTLPVLVLEKKIFKEKNVFCLFSGQCGRAFGRALIIY
jgi:hypothetical protein